MIAFVKLFVFLAIFLTIVHVCVLLYARSVRRERLERQWDSEQRIGDRDAFIRDGLAAYQRSLQRRLLWLIYIVPVTLIAILVYVLNFT